MKNDDKIFRFHALSMAAALAVAAIVAALLVVLTLKGLFE